MSLGKLMSVLRCLHTDRILYITYLNIYDVATNACFPSHNHTCEKPQNRN